MVTIQVLVPGQDEPYYLSESDVEGSKTIEHLRQYSTSYGLIDVLVPLVEWDEYMQFLQTGNPSIPALKVIDYLDNLEQAKTWFWNRYESSINNNSNESEQQILNIIDNDTSFTLKELFPILSVKDTLDMIPYLNIPHLPQFYIKHVLDYVYKDYTELNKFPTFSDIPKSVLYETYGYFIIKPLHQQLITATGIPKDNHIRRYVAQYYRNIHVHTDLNIGISDMRNNTLLIGPADKPYLAGYETHRGVSESPRVYYNWTDDPQLVNSYPPLDVYNPDSPYKPYTGYDTGLTNARSRIYSYNSPTTNGRDYYLFYPILDDPVSMIRYTISI